MKARQWIEQQRRKLAEMTANREREALLIINDLNALVKLRVQGSGQDYENKPFSPYSKKYARTRVKAGFQTAYVDFTRTGRLWANVNPVVIAANETSVTIEISARDSENVDKLKGALIHPKGNPRGQIIRPSKEEIELIADLNKKRIEKYIV